MQSGAWSGHYRYFLFQDNNFFLIAYAFLDKCLLEASGLELTNILHSILVCGEEIAELDIGL